LEAAGAENLEILVVPNSGELVPIEAPQAFIDLGRQFGRHGYRVSASRSRGLLKPGI
jgi:hypothetical protein